MGCQQSSTAKNLEQEDQEPELPSSIDPLWENGGTIESLVRIERNEHEWNKSTLNVAIGRNRFLTIDASRGGCILLDHDQKLIAIVKRRREYFASGSGFGIYKVDPVYPGQLPEIRSSKVKISISLRNCGTGWKEISSAARNSLSTDEDRNLAKWITREGVHTVEISTSQNRALIVILAVDALEITRFL